MRNRPSELELLEIAYKVLKEDLLSVLSDQNRYNGLMVARALKIVIRQIKSDKKDDPSELELLSYVLGKKDDVVRLNHMLSEKIRSSGLKPSLKNSSLIWESLVKISRDKVKESNPKYLRDC